MILHTTFLFFLSDESFCLGLLPGIIEKRKKKQKMANKQGTSIQNIALPKNDNSLPIIREDRTACFRRCLFATFPCCHPIGRTTISWKAVTCGVFFSCFIPTTARIKKDPSSFLLRRRSSPGSSNPVRANNASSIEHPHLGSTLPLILPSLQCTSRLPVPSVTPFFYRDL